MKRLRTPEFDRIARAFGWDKDPAKVGDDAALLPGGQLLCCDALAEGVHFRWDWSSPADVGWKAVAQNVADILAMGGLPTQAVWSVGMGRDWDDATFQGLARGAKAACKAYGCALVGGDTVRTKGPGFVSLSLLGEKHVRHPWARSAARIGDVVLLAGQPGFSAAGLASLSQGLEGKGPFREAIRLHRRPHPPLEAARVLFEAPIHAAIDLSDGLSSDARHLAQASDVRIVFELAALTPPPLLAKAAARLNVAPLDWVFHGGEDHALLLTASPRVLTNLPRGVRAVGRVENGNGVWCEGVDGKRHGMPPLGWVHA